MGVWGVLLVAATAVHAGFQLTVSTLVYPALTRVTPAEFASAHERHSRAVVPLVAFVYGFVAVSLAGALLAAPAELCTWAAALASGVAVLTTALRAAPLHTRLGQQGPDPALITSLLRADRVRTLAALLAVLAALTAVLRP